MNYKKMISWEKKDKNKLKKSVFKIKAIQEQYNSYYQMKRETHMKMMKSVSASYGE